MSSENLPWINPASRRVLDQMADRFLAIDRDDMIVFANESLLSAISRSESDFVGRAYWEEWADLRGTIIEQKFRQARDTQEAQRFQFYHASGSWIDVDVYPLGDYLQIYFRNVTRQRLRAEFASQEKFLRPLIDSIPHMAWASDLSNLPIYFNERWWDYTGLIRDAAYDPLHIVIADDLARYRDYASPFLAKGESYTFEIRLRREDGAMRWHTIRMEPQLNLDGLHVGWVGTGTDIHDQKIADDLLYRSEHELAQLVESIGDALLTVDREWRLLHFNAGAEALFGAKREDVLGRNTFEAFPLSANSEFERRYQITMETGREQDFEAYSETLQKWIHARTSRYGDGLAVILQDITDRKHREETLVEMEERLRFALAMADAGVWHLDTITNQAVWSPEYRALFGIGPDDPIPGWEEWMQKLHPEDRERTAAEISRSMKGWLDFKIEYRVLHPTKGVRWLVTAGGKVPHQHRLTGITYDITESRQQLSMLEATLNIGRTLMSEPTPAKVVQALTDATTEAIGANMGSFFYNEEDEEGGRFGLYVLSGVPRSSFESYPSVRNTPLFQTTFGGHGTVLVDDVMKDPRYGALSEGEGIPHGHLPVRSYLAVTVPSRSGRVLGGLLFGHSEPGRFTKSHAQLVESFAAQASVAYENALLYDSLERRVKERTAELEAANETLQGFTYHVSHDLRTPLRAIVSTSRIMEMDYGDQIPAEAHDLLKRQAEAARKLGVLIDDLLSISRLSSEELVRKPTDLTALGRDAAAEALAAHPDSSVRIEVEEGLKTEADVRLLRLAIHNLLENAVKYSPEGGTVRFGQDDRGFFVRDEGIGFESQYAERIFEPFQRLHRDEQFKGTGIGLANVRQVIERHGGKVWAEGALGKGSTFFFVLSC